MTDLRMVILEHAHRSTPLTDTATEFGLIPRLQFVREAPPCPKAELRWLQSKLVSLAACVSACSGTLTVQGCVRRRQETVSTDNPGRAQAEALVNLLTNGALDRADQRGKRRGSCIGGSGYSRDRRQLLGIVKLSNPTRI